MSDLCPGVITLPFSLRQVRYGPLFCSLETYAQGSLLPDRLSTCLQPRVSYLGAPSSLVPSELLQAPKMASKGEGFIINITVGGKQQSRADLILPRLASVCKAMKGMAHVLSAEYVCRLQ